jgi:hypothetical protein
MRSGEIPARLTRSFATSIDAGVYASTRNLVIAHLVSSHSRRAGRVASAVQRDQAG